MQTSLESLASILAQFHTINHNNQENNNMSTNHVRGRRPTLANIGKRLRRYTASDGHYMTTRERNLMLDIAGQLMSEGEFGRNELQKIIMDIRRVSVTHEDLHLQRLADQAMRWFNEDPIEETALDIAINAAREAGWDTDQAKAQSKAYGDYIVADDIDETVKVIIDNDARDVTMEAIVLSIRATLDSPLPGGWKKIVRLASIGQRLAQS